jgi:UDP-N-acetylmuramoyl-L-alanyl-D-glutamate--2,6-diaminopimelate ligase
MKKGQRLICVLGSCGGHRDKWKRPVMGEAAGRHCDHIIFTNEDPYDEDPGAILRDMRAGISDQDNNSKQVEEVVDRKEAIRRAIALAKPGDTVVMTGKGSEHSIHVAGGREVEWDEKRVAEETLVRELRLHDV